MSGQCVFGVDIGSCTSYVAKVEIGGVVVLSNELSSRCTPTILSLPVSHEGVRTVGFGAEPHLINQEEYTVSEVRDLLSAGCVDLEARGHRHAHKLTTVDQFPQGQKAVTVRLLNRDQAFLPQQLFAMILGYVKRQLAQDFTNASFYVLSCPIYFSSMERCAMLDAAKIAGINVQLTNDLLASALAYGYFQKEPPDQPGLVALIDFGYNGLQAGLVEFRADGMRIVCSEWDRAIGGRDLDRRLAAHLMQQFNLQHRCALSPDSHRKAFSKLLFVAERLKRQMSANRNPLPVDVECLHGDLDLKCHVSRDQFERLCEDLFEKVRACLVRLADKPPLNGDVSLLQSVEIVGGSTRLPRFKALVADVFQMAPSTTLNADEAVSRGCALMCAMNTNVFKVRRLSIVDVCHMSTELFYSYLRPSRPALAKMQAGMAVMTMNDSGAVVKLSKVNSEAVPVFCRNVHYSDQKKTVELDQVPYENRLELRYCVDECPMWKPEQRTIATYTLEAQLDDKDEVALHFDLDCGGEVQLRSAGLQHRSKRPKSAQPGKQISFCKTLSGVLPDSLISSLIQVEADMARQDAKNKFRAEVRNRLEEITFGFRDELDTLDDEAVRGEEAFRVTCRFVTDLTSEFETDQYSHSPVSHFQKRLQEVQEKRSVFKVWYQKWQHQQRSLRHQQPAFK